MVLNGVCDLCVLCVALCGTGMGLTESSPNFTRVFHQVIDLFAGYSQTGAHHLIQDYMYDLNMIGFDNKASSACVSGIWLLYEHPGYNPSLKGKVQYLFGDSYCSNLDLINTVSSVRFVGPPNGWKFDTITFYEGAWFQGSEEYLVQGSPYLQLNDQVNSAIVTGHSPWTVYEMPDYKGLSACLWPSDSEPGMFPDDPHLGSVLANSISSVRFGCHAKKNITNHSAKYIEASGSNRM